MFELPEQCSGVFDRMAFAIVVEIGPYASSAAVYDTRYPLGQFLLGVIVQVPPCRPVKTNVNVARSLDEFVGEAGTAGRAEDIPALAKGGIHLFIPPAAMAELDYVTAARIELSEVRAKRLMWVMSSLTLPVQVKSRFPVWREPAADGRHRWPRIKWRVELHRPEAARIVVKPASGGKPLWVEGLGPMPVIPT